VLLLCLERCDSTHIFLPPWQCRLKFYNQNYGSLCLFQRVAIFCSHLIFLQERTYIKNLHHDIHHYATYLVICYVISLRSTLHSNATSNSLRLLLMWSSGLWNYAVLQMDIKISEEYVMLSARSKGSLAGESEEHAVTTFRV